MTETSTKLNPAFPSIPLAYSQAITKAIQPHLIYPILQQTTKQYNAPRRAPRRERTENERMAARERYARNEEKRRVRNPYGYADRLARRRKDRTSIVKMPHAGSWDCYMTWKSP